MASKTKATGFTVRCPYCDNQDGDVIISLNDLECHCSNCDEEFTPEQARAKAAELLASWERAVRWVEVGQMTQARDKVAEVLAAWERVVRWVEVGRTMAAE